MPLVPTIDLLADVVAVNQPVHGLADIGADEGIEPARPLENGADRVEGDFIVQTELVRALQARGLNRLKVLRCGKVGGVKIDGTG